MAKRRLSEEELLAQARYDARQTSLYGDEHVVELQTQRKPQYSSGVITVVADRSPSVITQSLSPDDKV
jgi:hypothetical protein